MEQFDIENYSGKVDNIQNMFWEYCWFLAYDLQYQNGPIPPDQNMLILVDHNVSIPLVNNMYNGNMV